MASQMELAADVLENAPTVPGRPVLDRSALRAAFAQVYGEAVEAAQNGRSVTPAAQLTAAAERTGRLARPEAYVAGLGRLVRATPFQRGPGALEAVRALRERGWRTAVISNTIGEPGATLRPLLRTMGFDAVVEEYVFSDELPWTKPDPPIFREALRRLGVAPTAAVHVGDGWSDIEGARRAGMRAGILYTGLQRYGALYQALFLPPGWSAPETEYRISALEELVPLADRLLTGRRSS